MSTRALLPPATHRQRVCRLFKRLARELHNQPFEPMHHGAKLAAIRARFEAERRATDWPRIEAMIAREEARLDASAHYDPYKRACGCFLRFGGFLFGRFWS
jgi:hypothetical protein